MQTTRSANLAGRLLRSADEAATTVSMLAFWHASMILSAISPRLAISTRFMCVTGTKSRPF